MYVLVDPRDELVLDNRAVPVPIFSVLLGAPVGRRYDQYRQQANISTNLSKSRPHRWMRTVMKKTL